MSELIIEKGDITILLEGWDVDNEIPIYVNDPFGETIAAIYLDVEQVGILSNFLLEVLKLQPPKPINSLTK